MHIYSITVLKYKFELQYLYILLFYYILETETFYSITFIWLVTLQMLYQNRQKNTNTNNRENVEY